MNSGQHHSCRFCGTPLHHTFADLGTTPLANRNLRQDEIVTEPRFPLIARVCQACLLVQIDDSVPPGAIFSDYDYFSSYSTSWLAHARNYCDTMRLRLGLGRGSFVVEIASNDGYLLQNFLDLEMLGIEPAANIAKFANDRGIPTDVAFFGIETARRIVREHRRADLIAANNVLAHAPDTRDFVGGVALLLSKNGTATFEFPHLLRLIQGLQFDTIYHEHFFYLSLLTAERIFHASGLRIYDVEELSTHGGSLRLFVCHRSAGQAESDSVEIMRNKERAAFLDRLDGYREFESRIAGVKNSFLTYLRSAKASGRRIAAYGAAAKGNTFLNVCGAGYPDIEAAFDRNPAKQDKFTPGSHIPILSPDRLSAVRPDDLVILPWNIADEVMDSMSFIRDWGGRFVLAVPELRIV